MDVKRCPKDETHHFTQISNAFINDRRLSPKSKFILVFLLSKPPTWCFNFREILKYNKIGLKSIKSAIKELISTGYVFTYQHRDSNGRFLYYNYSVYETPVFLNATKIVSQPESPFRLPDKRQAEKPLADNQPPAINKIKIRLREETTTSPTIVVNTTAAVVSPEYIKKYNFIYSFLRSIGVINQKSIIKKYGLTDVIRYSHAFKDSISKANSPTGLLVTSIREKWVIDPLHTKKPKPFVQTDLCISCHSSFYYLDFIHTRNICGKCEKKGE